eukprot:366362-Chlamydomonas_euryale.AAC.12
MYRREDELVRGERAVVAPDRDKVVLGARTNAPDPRVACCDLRQVHAVARVERDALVGAADCEVLAV